MKPGPHSHIINGHVPVKTIKGEKPIKADGKLLVIDRSEEHTSELQPSIISYAVFCLKKKKKKVKKKKKK